MPYPAENYNICPCCGTEFENDDEECTHAQLREEWVSGGVHWFFRQPPPLWNPWTQLSIAGVPLPYTVSVYYSGVLNVDFVETRSIVPTPVAADQLFGMAA